MSAPSGFAEKVGGYSNIQLAKIIESSSEYTPEAMAIVMAEWDRRKLTAEAVAPAMAEIRKREEVHALPDPTRPQAFKGTGFICYGREFAPEAGYITTQWFCLFLLPLVPIQSFSVNRDSLGIAHKIPLNRPQVVRTYAFSIGMVVLVIGALGGAAVLAEKQHDIAAFGLVAASFLVPIFFLQLLRRNARRQKSTPKGNGT